MSNDNHNNIFDEDDALDYILYEKCEKEERGKKGGNGGCLGLFVLFLIPAVLLASFSWRMFFSA
ncbi:MAG: hypothetical protein SCH71_15960 [Desulfobulbaceae bacterium]|nr:hypothetical protein [Desulfobulbaceae bacterium]